MNEVILSKLSNSIGKLLVFNISFIDKQLEVYHNYMLDEAERIKPLLFELHLSPEQVDEVLTNFLK